MLLSGAALLLASSQQPSLAATAPKLVFVAGATGQTGRRVVQQLLASGVSVVAGVRDVAKAKKLGLDKGARVVKIDVTEPATLASALAGVDAVVCATGFTPSFNFSKDNAQAVDQKGTFALVDAAKAAGVTSFVLVSSLLTNAPAIGQTENGNYKFLNALGGILDAKRAAELHLASSGLRWTVIRPGGLSNDLPSVTGAIITRPEDTLLGLEGDPGREVSRDSVASLAIAALTDDLASNKIVEVVASPTAVALEPSKWFAV